MSRWAAAAAVGAAALASACGDAAVASCDPGGGGPDVERVASVGPGQWEERGLRPGWTELWRAGGTRPGQDLSQPVAFAASAEGRLAVSEFGLGEVVVVEPDGAWSGVWTRRGPGPHELVHPVGSAWTPEGDLMVVDVRGDKVVRMRGPDRVVEVVPVAGSYFGPLRDAGDVPRSWPAPDGTLFLITPPYPRPNDPATRTAFLLRLPPGADVPDTLQRVPVAVMGEGASAGFARIGAPGAQVAQGPDGRISAADPHALYRIDTWDSGGRLVRRLCRAAAPLPLRPGERGEDAASDDPSRRRVIADIRAAGPVDPLAPIGRLIVGARGRLWVQRDRPSAFAWDEGLYGVPGARFDVFDSDGGYLGEVAAPPGARLQAAAGDTAWALVFGDLDEPWIVAYRLELSQAG